MIRSADGEPQILVETLAVDEAQLQELVRANPDLIPIEEYGMTGPLLVVGRESTLASGAIDLAAVTRSGDLLVVELKTGPDNGDFRRVLAQLLDYGSDLWGQTFEAFEQSVAVRYFTGTHCREAALHGSRSLRDAAKVIWPDMDEVEFGAFRARLTEQLERGAFHYFVVAQRFTPTMLRTLDYLNAALTKARCFAVELVRFTNASTSAFESRTVASPQARAVRTPRSGMDEQAFLNQVEDEEYREALRRLFEAAAGLQLDIEWGAVGAALHLAVDDHGAPAGVMWVNPPGKPGWMGLTDVTLGYHRDAAARAAEVAPLFTQYLEAAALIPGAVRSDPGRLHVAHFDPAQVTESTDALIDVIANLAAAVASA